MRRHCACTSVWSGHGSFDNRVAPAPTPGGTGVQSCCLSDLQHQGFPCSSASSHECTAGHLLGGPQTIPGALNQQGPCECCEPAARCRGCSRNVPCGSWFCLFRGRNTVTCAFSSSLAGLWLRVLPAGSRLLRFLRRSCQTCCECILAPESEASVDSTVLQKKKPTSANPHPSYRLPSLGPVMVDSIQCANESLVL